MTLSTIRDFTADFETEIKAAQSRPLLKCPDCGEQTVLDCKYDTEKLCDNCLDRRAAYAQHKAKQKDFRKRQVNSGLPEDFHELSLIKYNEFFPVAKLPTGVAAGPVPAEITTAVKQRTAIRDAFMQYCDTINGRRPSQGARITGPAGTGKTHLLAALCNRFCYHGYLPLWVNGHELDTKITDEWGRTSREKVFRDRLAAEIACYDVIFIDDLRIPQAKPYAWYQNAVNDIVNEITIRKRLLFMTTNYRSKQELILQDGKPVRGQDPELYLERAYTESFTSRLSALCKSYPLTGPDLRLPA